MRRNRSWGSFLFACSMAAASASADVVRWDEARTVMGGQGCEKDLDAFVLANGDELSVVFTNLGLNLPGGSGNSTSGRKSCMVKVPAEISRGVYLADLTQRVSFGVTKSRRTSGAIVVNSRFFSFNVSPYKVDLPYGRAMNEPLLTNSRRDRFLVNSPEYRDWCNRTRNPKGIYTANLAVSGSKDSRNEDLIMFVDGLDLKFEVITALQLCGV